MANSRASTSPSERASPPALRRTDATLYVLASGLAGLGLGIALFYLNFLYRALGFDARAIGLLSAAQALGVVAGALPAMFLSRRIPRRSAIFIGGTVTGVGIVGILTQGTLGPLFVSATLLGAGGIVVASSGTALVADATSGLDRPRMFGRQVALGALASFVAISVAGALAAPVGALIGRAPEDALTIRAVIAVGGILAIVSAFPILFVRTAPIALGRLDPPHRRRLLLRFAAIEVAFGFGAGSFLPFQNLFFADRFGLSIAGVGVALGALAVAGSAGALLSGRYLVPWLGTTKAAIASVFGSLPFALAAAITGEPLVAGIALGIRAALMYGASPAVTALQQSSFAPAERAGVVVLFAIAWNGANAGGAALSGLVRAELGPSGYTANLLILVGAYAVAALLIQAFFRTHEPRGDSAGVLPADSAK